MLEAFSRRADRDTTTIQQLQPCVFNEFRVRQNVCLTVSQFTNFNVFFQVFLLKKMLKKITVKLLDDYSLITANKKALVSYKNTVLTLFFVPKQGANKLCPH